MWNTRTVARSVTISATLLATVSFTSFAHAAETPELRCRSGIQSALAKWTKSTFKDRLRCQSDILSGYEDPATNCVTGAGSPKLPGRLERARARFFTQIEARCGGVNFTQLSYPGPCAELASPVFDTQDLARCVGIIGKGIAERLMDVWYPPELDPARGPVSECITSIAKRASSMVTKELAIRLRCLLESEVPGAPVVRDCREQLPPYGQGTLDDDVNQDILRAQDAWLGSFPKACLATDFTEIDFGDECASYPNGGTGIVSFQACVFKANRQEIVQLMDLAFPSGPVCGNGIPQEGEDCDDGVANSDVTPDACRLDCTLPFCGDDTTDPGNDETCDDGNHDPLDGCDADCGLEFCGDGDVNDLPNEDCDDGNTNPNDRCTDECRNAVCGDGVVCTASACTSGPDGGPELCDNGEDNAPGAMCDVDCSGFAKSCTLTVGVTNTVNAAAITYDLTYQTADGEIAGTGSAVQCTSAITGALASFFDNETTRKVRESVIVDDGFQTPIAIARCTYVTNETTVNAADFPITVISATDPDFNPIAPAMSVTSIVCD